MQSKKDLIEAFGLIREKYSRITSCPLCPQEVHVRRIKRHFLEDHKIKKITRKIVNQLSDPDQALYRAFNNRKRKFTCQFCNENFDRISFLLNHLSKTHKIALIGRVCKMIDLHVAALQAEPETGLEIRRRLHITETPQETASL